MKGSPVRVRPSALPRNPGIRRFRRSGAESPVAGDSAATRRPEAHRSETCGHLGRGDGRGPLDGSCGRCAAGEVDSDRQPRSRCRVRPRHPHDPRRVGLGGNPRQRRPAGVQRVHVGTQQHRVADRGVGVLDGRGPPAERRSARHLHDRDRRDAGGHLRALHRQRLPAGRGHQLGGRPADGSLLPASPERAAAAPDRVHHRRRPERSHQGQSVESESTTRPGSR